MVPFPLKRSCYGSIDWPGRRSGLGKSGPPVEGLAYYANTLDMLATDVVGARGGAVQVFNFAAGVVTITDLSAAFVATEIGQCVKIASALNAGNNGTFVVTARPSATQISFANAAGVAAAGGPATWELGGRCQSLADRYAGTVFAQAADALRLSVYDGQLSLISGGNYTGKLLSGTGTQYLQDVGAIGMSFTGDTSATVFAVFALRANPSAGNYLTSISDGTGSNLFYCGTSGATSSLNFQMSRVQGGASTSTTAPLAAPAFSSLMFGCWQYGNSTVNATGRLEPSYGLAGAINSGTGTNPSTLRSPIATNTLRLGCLASSGSPVIAAWSGAARLCTGPEIQAMYLHYRALFGGL